MCVWTACVLYRTLDLFSSQFRTLITEPLATFMVCMWELEYVGRLIYSETFLNYRKGIFNCLYGGTLVVSKYLVVALCY